MPQLYLKKDNNDLISHCQCAEALISYPPQQACPWCGCGWLFTCQVCRKAFTFARGVEISDSLFELARRDITNGLLSTPDENEISAWVADMEILLSEIQIGQQYVYFDGAFIPTVSGELKLQGWHSNHELNCIPQMAALQDKTIMFDLLRNQEYWAITENTAQENEKTI